MESRFAAHQARLTALLGNGINQVARKAQFSPFQWAICVLLAVVTLIVGASLISIVRNTSQLNTSIRDNTRAVADSRTDITRSLDSIDRKVADTNQKLLDLTVEIDDLIAEQRQSSKRQADLDADTKKTSQKTEAGRSSRRSDELVVHRRRAH